MILEKHIPEANLKEAYWLKVSSNAYYVMFLELNYDKERLNNVIATAHEINPHAIDEDIDISTIKNGAKVKVCFITDVWLLKLNIWPKYYFPIINESNNQFYHKEDDHDIDEILNFSILLKEAYTLAMKISGLETY